MGPTPEKRDIRGGGLPLVSRLRVLVPNALVSPSLAWIGDQVQDDASPLGVRGVPWAALRPSRQNRSPSRPAESRTSTRVNSRERLELHHLMVRLADGDRRAFDGVFTALEPVVSRLCRHLLSDAADAEDAAQAALLTIFLEASRFNPTRDAVGWALSIAAFECRTLRQKRRRSREEPLAPVHIIPDERTPEGAVLDADLRSALEGVLEEMTPGEQETLRAVSGQAERPAVPPATFRKRAERALRRLREVWRSRYGLD